MPPLPSRMLLCLLEQKITTVALSRARGALYAGAMAFVLGVGSTDNRGDGLDENDTPLENPLDDLGEYVDFGVGKTARAISCWSSHTCAILNDGRLRCWGDGSYGKRTHLSSFIRVILRPCRIPCVHIQALPRSLQSHRGHLVCLPSEWCMVTVLCTLPTHACMREQREQ